MALPVRPKKRLGQHFMTSRRDLDFIVDSLVLEPGEKVLEIGPGLGALTEILLGRGCPVVAVEKDVALADLLRQKYQGADLEVIPQDILLLDLGKKLSLSAPIKVVGNIPYNITSPILEWLVDHRAWVSEAVLTVQWEVAQRLAAKPGKKDWGSLSVFLQFYSDVELLRKIDKSHFNPAPRVDSAVLRFRFLKTPRFSLSNEPFFFALVRRAFQKRRKTLLNALEEKGSETLGKQALAKAFSGLQIDPRRRPETLSLKEWALLSESLGSAR